MDCKHGCSIRLYGNFGGESKCVCFVVSTFFIVRMCVCVCVCNPCMYVLHECVSVRMYMCILACMSCMNASVFRRVCIDLLFMCVHSSSDSGEGGTGGHG